MNKFIKCSFVLLSLYGVSTINSYAQTASKTKTLHVLPPPQTTPEKLPPLPQHLLKDIKSNQLPTVIIDRKKSYVVNHVPKIKHVSMTYNFNDFFNLLNTEVKRMSNALHSVLRIKLVNTKSRRFQEYKMMGMINITDKILSRYDTGLTSVLSKNNKLVYRGLPICYVLVDPTKAKEKWETFVVPLAQVSNKKSGPAWLIAHQVAHCLDNLELRKQINEKLVWKDSELEKLGLLPIALNRAYGKSFSKDTFLSSPMKLYSQVSQEQFSERLADAFASIWMLKLNNTPESINVIANIRSSVMKDRPHYTKPVFTKVLNNQGYIFSEDKVSGLWSLARKIQISSGVSLQAINIYQKPNKDNHMFGQHIDSNKIAKWKVTSGGLVPLDKHGNVLINVNKKNTNNSTSFGSNSFNSLNKFGH